MADHLEFDCWYQGGASLLNQTFCPNELNGEPLLYTESRLVTDVVSRPIPWWLVILALLMAVENQRKS